MSVLSLFDTQAALYTKLSGTAALTALLAQGAASILDHVPAGTPFPYITIGEMSARPLDTQRHAGNEISITLYVYARGTGFKETKNILAAIDDALHNANFAVPNQTLILCQRTDSDIALDADGITRRGALRYRIITEPAA